MRHAKTDLQTLLRLAWEDPDLLAGAFLSTLLEASLGEALQTRVLCQELRPPEAAMPELVLDQWEPVLERRVLLQVAGSGMAYLYVHSLIVPSTVPVNLYIRLLQGEEPLGRIIQALRLPTFREVIAHGRARLEEIADRSVAAFFETDLSADVLYRTSLLSFNPRAPCATMRITEMLPVAFVFEQQDGCVSLVSGATRRERDLREEDAHET
jgi:chorismate-pyruvate lyase